MSQPATSSPTPAASSFGSALLWLRRNEMIALVLLFLAFVIGIEVIKPGTVNQDWVSNTLLFAATLGIVHLFEQLRERK